MKRSVVAVFMLALSGIGTVLVSAADAGMIGVNVVVRTNITKSILADLGTHGKVRDVVDEIRSVAMQVRSSELKVIQSLPYVAAANPDAVRTGAPIDTVQVEDFASGLNTWDLDAVNVTDLKSGPDRVTSFTGQGVYVAVLDTGLLDSWRQYFPQERIASQFGVSFGGGGGEMGSVSTQPNKW